MAENVLRREWMVKPSECNANRELPLTMLVSQLIDLATDHANMLGIGFLALEQRNLGWVLSRLSVEMSRWPKNGEKYVLSTWIESYNSHFSERCFSVVTHEGEIIGYCRTIWVIIDLGTHKSVGTAGTVLPPEMIAGLRNPIPKITRHKPFEPDREVEYIFKYTDLDFYRHVNTVRYLSILLNQFTLEEFDRNFLSRFEISFAHEAKYGEKVIIRSIDEEVPAPSLVAVPKDSRKRIFELTVEGTPILTSSVTLTER